MLTADALRLKSILLTLFVLTLATGCGSGGGEDPASFPDPLLRWYRDLDNDGYGDGSSMISVSQPDGYIHEDDLIAFDGDCNDMNASVNPGATENCTDLIDEDCDESLNNGCTAPAEVEDFCQSGTPIADAAPISPSSLAHPFYIGSAAADQREWNYLLPTGAGGIDPSGTELVLCLNEYTVPRGNCAYTNGTVIDRYQYHLDVTVSDAAGGGLVADASIAGTTPPSCPDYIVSGGGADRYGSRLGMIDVFDAVKLYTGSRQIALDLLQGESLGICAGDGNLWVSSLVNEAADDTMTQIDAAGDIQAQHPIYHADDLAYDGTHVWALRASSYSIKKYDLNGNEVESFSSIYPSPHGIAHDGQHLLVFCGSDAIYRLEDNGAMTQLANTPAYQSVSAMAYQDGAVWVSEGGNIHRLGTDGTHLGTKVFKGVTINSMDLDSDQLFIKIDGRETVFVYPLVEEPFDRKKLPILTVEAVAQHADRTFWGYTSGSGSETQYQVKVVGASGEDVSTITLDTDFTARGMAFDGVSLWVNNSYYLTQHHLADGSRMGSISLPDDPDESNGSKIPCGQITYADGSFWALSSGPSTKRIFQFDLNGTLIRQIPAPVGGLSGIAFDGQFLWVSDSDANRIYKLATDGDVKLSLPSPGFEPAFLYSSGGVLSVVDTETHEIYDWRITTPIF